MLIPAVLTLVAAVALVSACDRVPLLAPAGTVITIFPANTTVPLNGEIEIVATVIENGTVSTTTPGNGTGGTGSTTTTTKAAGTPVQNGTLVSFTATIGRIEPREARTHNGEVRVRFIADGGSGTAKITAYSGGAVGTIENLLVGSAAADHLIVSVTPQTIPSSGGTATVQARVENTAGAGLVGVPVTFSTTAGSLSPTTTTTDANGIATTSISTSREATVTASAGTKTGTTTVRVNTSLGLTLASSPEAPVAGQRVTFTVATATGTSVSDATINFGDGDTQVLGAQRSVTHTYDAPGRYTAVVTARDANGETGTASTEVSVGSVPATLTASPASPALNQNTEFTVAGVPATVSVREYRWNFGDGTTTNITTANVNQHQFARTGTYVVKVDVIGVGGEVVATVQRQIVVTP